MIVAFLLPLVPQGLAQTLAPAAEVICPGFQMVEFQGPSCPVPGGWDVILDDGTRLLTHGRDAPRSAPGFAPASHNPALDPLCVDDATTDHHFLVIYARSSDAPDRYATQAPIIRNQVRESNGVIRAEAATFGAVANLRVRCAAGTIEVRNEALPTSSTADSFATIVSNLRDQGDYESPWVKYWIWYDDGTNVDQGGQGNIQNDDTLSLWNQNNGAINAAMYAISYGSLNSHTLLHEAGHTMGAVQLSSPNSSGYNAGTGNGFHCNDGQDIMCYADGGHTSNYNPNVCPGNSQWDCNNNDYFHPAPAVGSYLATHWNLASPLNRFLQMGENGPPIMDYVSCFPGTSEAGQLLSCTFRATDSSTDLHYTIDWGDGTFPQNVPPSGGVPPNVEQFVQRFYSAPGTYAIRVTAVDHGAPRLSSAPLQISQTVTPVNVAPSMATLDCPPEPSAAGQAVTCSFRATDASAGVHYTVDWGDGSPTTRVPASGFYAPGTTQVANHAWSQPGQYPVSATATDTGGLTSSPLQITHGVAAVNARPAMTQLNCSPGQSQTGQTVACTLSSSDDSSGVYYTVDWGDGSPVQRVPVTGTVAPAAPQSVSHAWTQAGSFAVFASATDNANPASTSLAMRWTQSVDAPNEAPSVQGLYCSPGPSRDAAPATCYFYAADDSTGVFFTVAWGDGSPTTRVPATGTMAPGVYADAVHTWTTPGTYSVAVTAEDDESPALVSPAVSWSQVVQHVNRAPVGQSVTCAPNPVLVGATATCSFLAADDSAGIYYMVDWGDGSPTTRVPATGTVAPGVQQTAAHAWTSASNPLVSVRAHDQDPIQAASSDLLIWSQDVRAPPGNQAPTITLASCSPLTSLEAQAVTCSVRASDDSAGVHYEFHWADGTPATRVPATGTVAPGTTQTTTHAWEREGTYTVWVVAFDNGSPSRSSDASTLVQTVREPPCSLVRTGTLLVGLAGIEQPGISFRDEPIPVNCRGHVFTLKGTTASDFHVCWYQGTVLLGCNRATFDDTGQIPATATTARIILFAGANALYTLRAT